MRCNFCSQFFLSHSMAAEGTLCRFAAAGEGRAARFACSRPYNNFFALLPEIYSSSGYLEERFLHDCSPMI